MQTVYFTCPIEHEGHTIADFEAAANIVVIEEGVRRSWNNSGEDPDWKIQATFVDTGKFNRETGELDHDLSTASAELNKFISSYLYDTPKGQAEVLSALTESGEGFPTRAHPVVHFPFPHVDTRPGDTEPPEAA